MLLELIVGPAGKPADGSAVRARTGRLSDLIISALRGDYAEATSRGQMFTALLAATTATPSAGQQNGAAAAAVTQFALFNPAGSGINLELTKVFMGAISGTPPGGPMYHSYAAGAPNSTVALAAGANSLLGGPGSVARYLASAAGVALTGAPNGLTTLRPSTISLFAAALAAGANIENAVEEVKGDIIVPPGYMWVPTWASAGVAFLNAYGVSWLEVPI